MTGIAFVFPGQGAQYIGMAREICSQYPEALKVFEKASQVVGFNMENMVFDGDEDNLKITENTQPAIVTASIACLQPLLEEGIKADYTAGLSLGEYASHVYSETFAFEEAVKILKLRGRFMQEAVPLGVGSMTAVLGLSREEILDVCALAKKEGIVEPANFNCPGQIVIAGEVKAVNKAAEIAVEKGAKRVVPLAVSAPFHCSMLTQAGEKLGAEIEKIEMHPMKIPVLANVSGNIIPGVNHVKESLVRQVSNPVLWEDCVRTMIGKGVNIFVEIGPGKVLCGFIRKIDKNVTTLNVEDISSLEATLRVLKG